MKKQKLYWRSTGMLKNDEIEISLSQTRLVKDKYPIRFSLTKNNALDLAFSILENSLSSQQGSQEYRENLVELQKMVRRTEHLMRPEAREKILKDQAESVFFAE